MRSPLPPHIAHREALHQLGAERARSRREVTLARGRMEACVVAAREAGASWTQIGYVLGVSAQAVCKRYAGLRRVVDERQVAG